VAFWPSRQNKELAVWIALISEITPAILDWVGLGSISHPSIYAANFSTNFCG
jgi:hypothetical protein